jgi:hypothetical protein
MAAGNNPSSTANQNTVQAPRSIYTKDLTNVVNPYERRIAEEATPEQARLAEVASMGGNPTPINAEAAAAAQTATVANNYATVAQERAFYNTTIAGTMLAQGYKPSMNGWVDSGNNVVAKDNPEAITRGLVPGDLTTPNQKKSMSITEINGQMLEQGYTPTRNGWIDANGNLVASSSGEILNNRASTIKQAFGKNLLAYTLDDNGNVGDFTVRDNSGRIITYDANTGEILGIKDKNYDIDMRAVKNGNDIIGTNRKTGKKVYFGNEVDLKNLNNTTFKGLFTITATPSNPLQLASSNDYATNLENQAQSQGAEQFANTIDNLGGTYSSNLLGGAGQATEIFKVSKGAKGTYTVSVNPAYASEPMVSNWLQNAVNDNAAKFPYASIVKNSDDSYTITQKPITNPSYIAEQGFKSKIDMAGDFITGVETVNNGSSITISNITTAAGQKIPLSSMTSGQQGAFNSIFKDEGLFSDVSTTTTTTRDKLKGITYQGMPIDYVDVENSDKYEFGYNPAEKTRGQYYLDISQGIPIATERGELLKKVPYQTLDLTTSSGKVLKVEMGTPDADNLVNSLISKGVLTAETTAGTPEYVSLTKEQIDEQEKAFNSLFPFNQDVVQGNFGSLKTGTSKAGDVAIFNTNQPMQIFRNGKEISLQEAEQASNQTVTPAFPLKGLANELFPVQLVGKEANMFFQDAAGTTVFPAIKKTLISDVVSGAENLDIMLGASKDTLSNLDAKDASFWEGLQGGIVSGSVRPVANIANIGLSMPSNTADSIFLTPKRDLLFSGMGATIASIKQKVAKSVSTSNAGLGGIPDIFIAPMVQAGGEVASFGLNHPVEFLVMSEAASASPIILGGGMQTSYVLGKTEQGQADVGLAGAIGLPFLFGEAQDYASGKTEAYAEKGNTIAAKTSSFLMNLLGVSHEEANPAQIKKLTEIAKKSGDYSLLEEATKRGKAYSALEAAENPLLIPKPRTQGEVLDIMAGATDLPDLLSRAASLFEPSKTSVKNPKFGQGRISVQDAANADLSLLQKLDVEYSGNLGKIPKLGKDIVSSVKGYIDGTIEQSKAFSEIPQKGYKVGQKINLEQEPVDLGLEDVGYMSRSKTENAKNLNSEVSLYETELSNRSALQNMFGESQPTEEPVSSRFAKKGEGFDEMLGSFPKEFARTLNDLIPESVKKTADNLSKKATTASDNLLRDMENAYENETRAKAVKEGNKAAKKLNVEAEKEAWNDLFKEEKEPEKASKERIDRANREIQKIRKENAAEAKRKLASYSKSDVADAYLSVFGHGKEANIMDAGDMSAMEDLFGTTDRKQTEERNRQYADSITREYKEDRIRREGPTNKDIAEAALEDAYVDRADKEMSDMVSGRTQKLQANRLFTENKRSLISPSTANNPDFLFGSIFGYPTRARRSQKFSSNQKSKTATTSKYSAKETQRTLNKLSQSTDQLFKGSQKFKSRGKTKTASKTREKSRQNTRQETKLNQALNLETEIRQNTRTNLETRLNTRVRTQLKNRLKQEITPRFTPITGTTSGTDIFGEPKKKKGNFGKTYTPDITAILTGIKRKGKAPKYTTGFDIQPIFEESKGKGKPLDMFK